MHLTTAVISINAAVLEFFGMSTMVLIIMLEYFCLCTAANAGSAAAFKTFYFIHLSRALAVTPQTPRRLVGFFFDLLTFFFSLVNSSIKGITLYLSFPMVFITISLATSSLRSLPSKLDHLPLLFFTPFFFFLILCSVFH